MSQASTFFVLSLKQCFGETIRTTNGPGIVQKLGTCLAQGCRYNPGSDPVYCPPSTSRYNNKTKPHKWSKRATGESAG